MRDLRAIRKYELEWKEAQRTMEENKEMLGKAGHFPGNSPSLGGGGLDLEGVLDQLAEEGEL